MKLLSHTHTHTHVHTHCVNITGCHTHSYTNVHIYIDTHMYKHTHTSLTRASPSDPVPCRALVKCGVCGVYVCGVCVCVYVVCVWCGVCVWCVWCVCGEEHSEEALRAPPTGGDRAVPLASLGNHDIRHIPSPWRRRHWSCQALLGPCLVIPVNPKSSSPLSASLCPSLSLYHSLSNPLHTHMHTEMNNVSAIFDQKPLDLTGEPRPIVSMIQIVECTSETAF